ncbi:MAG: protein kinase [Acidobacteria bacterium]|nr:protein kinase [Acidobacteriota bacterium]
MPDDCNPTVRILPAGSELGPYSVEELLGVGGFALVYRATDRRLGRHVALKVVAAGAVPQQRLRLLAEARSAAALNHPNIATIFEAGEIGSDCFIAMEYVEGRTLRHYLHAAATPLSVLLGYLRQTAQAIAKAHAAGIVHCDLKPDNIMVTPDGLVKVLDFGLARLSARSRSSGHGDGASAVTSRLADKNRPDSPWLEGTLGYMSPEQAAGVAKLDARTDIFSFGCVLYEAVAHRCPFAAETEEAILYRLRSEAPPPLARYSPGVPEALQSLVDRCLEKDRVQRCASMADVESALSAILSAMLAGPPTSWVRRRWVLLVAASAAIPALWLIGLLRGPPAFEPRTIAVIPYTNGAGGTDTTYLADGIGEGIINALTQTPGLRIMARSSSYRFRGEQIDVRKAARRLEVGLLVLLSVVRTGDQLRVTVDLVAADGAQLWIQTYRPMLTDLAALETGIAGEVAHRVGAQLSEIELARLAKAARVKPEAYDRFLRGRYQQRLYTLESMIQAAAHYEQAVAIDPAFALAHAELANVYRYLSGSGAKDASSTLPRAEASARRALAADADLADAHVALAEIRKDRWDWPGAESEYRKALDLNSNLASAHQGYAIFLGVMGRHEAAISEIRRGLELDPLGLPMMVHSGAVYYNARRFGDALAALQRAAEVDPQAPAPWAWIGMTQAAAGRYKEAVQAYEKAAEFGDHTASTQCYYSFSLARAGRGQQAARLLDRIRQSSEFVPPSTMAIAYLGVGRQDLAVYWLHLAYERKDPLLQYISVEPHFDGLGRDAAFRALLRAIGLRR